MNLDLRTGVGGKHCDAYQADGTTAFLEENGRIRLWGYVPALGEFLRVVTLAGGLTVHNVFSDRSYQKDREL
jgi:hypothetical protein